MLTIEMAREPALQIGLEKDYEGALANVRSVCGPLAPDSDVRLGYAVEVLRMSMLAMEVAGGSDDEIEQMATDSLSFLSAGCEVDARAILAALEQG